MSSFLHANHMFLRNPHGGVEGLAEMRQAGFDLAFCNIGDYPEEEWQLVRDRGNVAGVTVGPWLRTSVDGTSSTFDPDRLAKLIDTAHRWGTPYIVNAESEINGQQTYLDYIVDECGSDDWALSTEPTPYANNDWSGLPVPVLPQCFGPNYGGKDAEERLLSQWHGYGVKCMVPTYGSYNQWSPDLYRRLEPYGVYTADDCGGNYSPWSPKGEFSPCDGGGTPMPSPPPGNDIPPPAPDEKIGSEHGITALVDWLQKQPNMPQRTAKYDPKKPGTWPWPERLERTLKILAQDHDERL